MRTQVIISVSALLLCGSGLAQPANNSKIKPIDPELVAAKLKRGKFIAESTEQGTNGQTQKSAEAMCMDEMTANTLPIIAMMGMANCEPISTSETKTSMSVAGICRKSDQLADGKVPFVPNFYAATLRWSADGKTIDLDVQRSALVNDKPSDKVLSSTKQKFKFQSANCK